MIIGFKLHHPNEDDILSVIVDTSSITYKICKVKNKYLDVFSYNNLKNIASYSTMKQLLENVNYLVSIGYSINRDDLKSLEHLYVILNNK